MSRDKLVTGCAWAAALVLALQLVARAQSYPCQPPPQVKQALRQLSFEDDTQTTSAQRKERKSVLLRSLMSRFPDDPFVHRQHLNFLKQTNQQDAAISYYKALLEKHPDDPLYLYLYGASLVDKNSQEGIAYIQKALERAPDLPWAYLALARIFSAQKDKQKVRTHLEKFMALCPSNLEAYGLLSQIDDREFLKEAAQKLRALLQNRSDELTHYQTLWRLEFRASPASEHAQVRKRVEQDLKRLRELNLVSDKDWILTLQEGYKITGDAEGTRWAEDLLLRQFPNWSQTMLLVLSRWNEANPRPGKNDPPEKIRAYNQSLLRASEEWIRRWPNHPYSWLERLSAISELEDVPAAEVEAAGEGLLSAYEKQADDFYMLPPPSIQVAALYLKRNIRLERVPELVQRGFKEVEKRTERDLQQGSSSPEFKKIVQDNLDYTYWRSWPLLVEAYVKTNQREKAREVLFQMENWLAQQKTTERTYASRQTTYWKCMAQLAEAENRKLDALTFYQIALLNRPKEVEAKDELADKAQKLWKELGGSAEGWQAWVTRAGTATSPAADTLWEKLDKPLPDFELQDIKGRTWKLADLKGKVTFINIWATWCGPCRLELPYVQKLAERLKGRQDVLVLTLNVDSNLGLIEPYMKKEGLNFPVIPAYSYVESITGVITIPRNWVVGPDGTLRLEQVGFGGEGERWLEQALDVIEKARGSNRKEAK
jgi:cytochrome c biogenesis protein CcmG/thiol:disulfide interchange protein DsbE